jgi:hypothetical protein
MWHFAVLAWLRASRNRIADTPPEVCGKDVLFGKQK